MYGVLAKHRRQDAVGSYNDLRIRFTAAPEDRIHIERSIELSRGQFCGVSEMLGKTASITWELEITPR